MFGGNIGNIREAYVVAANQGGKFFPQKIIRNYDLLVGGKKKSLKSANHVVRYDIYLPYGNVIHL